MNIDAKGEIAVKCKECGADLGFHFCVEAATVTVIPCASCSNTSYDDGHEAGYEDGYSEGLADGERGNDE